MNPTPVQTHQAIQNTLKKPRNLAPAIFQAIQNESPSTCNAEAFVKSVETREHGHDDFNTRS